LVPISVPWIEVRLAEDSSASVPENIWVGFLRLAPKKFAIPVEEPTPVYDSTRLFPESLELNCFVEVPVVTGVASLFTAVNLENHLVYWLTGKVAPDPSILPAAFALIVGAAA